MLYTEIKTLSWELSELASCLSAACNSVKRLLKSSNLPQCSGQCRADIYIKAGTRKATLVPFFEQRLRKSTKDVTSIWQHTISDYKCCKKFSETA